MSIDEDIARFDWPHIQTYLGHADTVPDVLRRLVTTPDDKEAAQLGNWMERILFSVAGPSEACSPVAIVLVAGLPTMTPPGHKVALDLLSQLSSVETTGPAHEHIGAVEVEDIRQAVAGGFQH